MHINEDIKKISDEYIELVENLIPQSVLHPVSRLIKKRVHQDHFYLKAGRLGIAYTLLIVVFALFSMFMIDSLKGDPLHGRHPIINAGIFSSDHPGSLVSAFREVVR